MRIRFTKHASAKFAVLRKQGFPISKLKVLETVQKPERVDRSRLPLYIAQSVLDNRHVLRIVYKKEGSQYAIITFYPGRKSDYEKRR